MVMRLHLCRNDRGRDNADQLLHIMRIIARIIGTPDDRTLRKMAAVSVRLCSLIYHKIYHVHDQPDTYFEA